MAKHKRPFTDSDLFKETMAVTAETVLSDFKYKDNVKTALPALPLWSVTINRRAEALSEDLDQQVFKAL